MNDFKARLELEAQKLNEKIEKLDAFLMSGRADLIDDIQKDLLIIQASAMNTYCQCLKVRLERL